MNFVEDENGEIQYQSLDDPTHPDFDNVYVSESKITNAEGLSIGKGLFAKREFRKGEYICGYGGSIIPYAIAHGQYYPSDYVIDINSKWCLDADEPNACYAMYINDPIISSKINCAFVVSNAPERRLGVKIPGIYMKALKKIKAGHELFASYGNEYWSDKEHYNRLTSDLQRVLYRRSQSVRKMVNEEFDIPRRQYISDDVESDDD